MKIKKANKKTNKICKKYFGNWIDTGTYYARYRYIILYYPGVKTC